jgi:TonB family protein
MLTELLAAGAAVAAATAPPAPAPEVIIAPHWLVRPKGNDVAAAYPDRAKHALISGRAELSCLVAADGRLEHCRTYAEAPVGQGFGDAALTLAPRFRMEPPALLPPGAEPTVFIPIRFIIAGHPIPLEMIMASPRWMSAPTFADLGGAFPDGAKVDGEVTLRCDVWSQGSLGNCRVLDERPTGSGFAKAAHSLVRRFRVDMDGRVPLPGDNLVADLKIHFSSPESAGFRERRIGQPTWLAVADPAQAAELFPVAASAKGLRTGRGVASCGVGPDGSLRDCVPLAGDPDGVGFSEAAVKIASVMRMNPWTDAGGPVDGAHVDLPVRFDLSAAKP